MNILSLFDGISCGHVALTRLGIKINMYYASEIEQNSIKITQKNYPRTRQLGDVRLLDISKLPRIDLLLAGSPCQDLSPIKEILGEGLKGKKSSLFWEVIRIWEGLGRPHFLYENVMMVPEFRDQISGALGVKPICINSRILSAQSRPRMYWTDIPQSAIPTSDHPDVLKDILEPDVSEKYFYNKKLTLHPSGNIAATLHINTHDMLKRVYSPLSKCPTLTCISGGYQEKKVLIDGRARKLTPLEYERLQTLPEGYTLGFSDTVRRSCIGDGWTVDVIVMLLKGLISLKN